MLLKSDMTGKESRRIGHRWIPLVGALSLVSGEIMKLEKLWRQLPASEYAELFPRKPKALRKIAYGLRQLGASGAGNPVGSDARIGQGNQVFTMNEWELAKACGVSRRTLQRYIGLFESYGILEVKRWRYRKTGASPNSYRLYFGSVIPENGTIGGGYYPISAREIRCRKS
jgi:hypothetical protein